MIVAEMLHHGAATLAAAGIPDGRREARMLLHGALGLPDRTMLDPAADIDPAGFDRLLARRAAREPMAFLLGRQGFWTLELRVSPATLIPRADSETLVAAALAAFPDRAAVRRILDLGTGTGALLLASLVEFPGAVGVGVDVVPAAVALAAGNARANGLADRAMFLAGCWGAPLAGRFDLVLANPPYIRSEAIAALMPEVAEYEPRSALDGGPDGLAAYRAILRELPALMQADGAAILEVGEGQARPVAAIAASAGLAECALHKDLGGIARALVLRGRHAKKSFGGRRAGG